MNRQICEELPLLLGLGAEMQNSTLPLHLQLEASIGDWKVNTYLFSVGKGGWAVERRKLLQPAAKLLRLELHQF